MTAWRRSAVGKITQHDKDLSLGQELGLFDTWSMASRAAPVNLQQPADGVSAVPVQASWLQLASEAAWSQLTEEEQSAATALESIEDSGLSALAVLLHRRAEEQASARDLTLVACRLSLELAGKVTAACGVDIAALSSPAQWLSALQKFERTTTAEKWGELESAEGKVCAGWRGNFGVLVILPYVVVAAIVKEAIAGPKHWLVRPALTQADCKALILAHFAPHDMLSIVANVLFASGSHFGSKAYLNCCIEIMMQLLTAAERKSVSVTDLDASSQSTSMDGSYAGSKEIRVDIENCEALAGLSVSDVLSVFKMLDALLVVAEAQRLPANACVAVYGKPARESPVMQVLATMKLRVLEFSHPTLVTRAGIQQNMWLNSVLANPSHMDEMDKRTAEFVESVRGSKVSCSFYSEIQAQEKHVLRQWISWFNEPKTQAFLQHGHMPCTARWAGTAWALRRASSRRSTTT